MAEWEVGCLRRVFLGCSVGVSQLAFLLYTWTSQEKLVSHRLASTQSSLLSSSGKGSGMRAESGKQKQKALLCRSALKMIWKRCRTGETEMVNQNEKGARVMGDHEGHGV